MKKINTTDVMIWIAIVTPFIYAAFVWDQLPPRLVSHYGMNGKPDDTMPKATFLLLMGGIQVFVYALTRYMPGAGVFSNEQSGNYHRLRLVVSFFLSGLMGWTLYASTQAGLAEDSSPIMFIVMVLVAAIGNYMTTVKPNFFVGIRTPWTLFSETVWRKTHQMAGRLWVGGGVTGAILLLLVPKPWQMPIVGTIAVVLAVVPLVYSYWAYRNEKRRAGLL
ncbi:SdpI family protein [Rudanella lutea]|uniref:SdpI family protein n=1 Tax=Rudanella lutea TaxID=451374 RepID=UPI0003682C64|nr:SdpI family protein [Rudanella lutea]